MLEDLRPGDTSAPAAAGAPAPVELWHHTIDESVFLGQPKRAQMWPWLLVALALHVGIGTAIAAGWMDWSDARARSGASGSELEAISVEVEVLPGRATATRDQSTATELPALASLDVAGGGAPAMTEQSRATASEGPVQPTPSDPESASEPEPHDTKSKLTLAEQPSPPEPDAPALSAGLPKPEPLPAAVEPPRALPAEIARTPDREPERRPDAPNATAPVTPAAPAAPAGGVASSGADQANRPASVRAAAASPGEMRAFARSLAEALARTRPPNGSARAKGTVNVEFIVGEEGRAETARVARSSGFRALDEIAIDAVRKARLPRPPAGVTLAERTFVVPYHFR